MKINNIFKIISKIIFWISWLPYVFIILSALYSSFFGVPERGLLYIGQTIYGIDALLQQLFILTFSLTYIQVIPLCFLYQIGYIVYVLNKRRRKNQ